MLWDSKDLPLSECTSPIKKYQAPVSNRQYTMVIFTHAFWYPGRTS